MKYNTDILTLLIFFVFVSKEEWKFTFLFSPSSLKSICQGTMNQGTT